MSKSKVTRRSFLRLLGIGAAGMAVRPRPSPVDMSKERHKGEASLPEMLRLSKQRRDEWVHPCTDKTEPDGDCGHCNWYFCPLARYNDSTGRWSRPMEYRFGSYRLENGES